MANKRRKGGKMGRPPKIIVSTDGVNSTMPIKYTRKCGSCQKKIVEDDSVLLWETMEFCNKNCLEKLQTEIGSTCTNCNSSVKPIRIGKLCVRIGYKIRQFCNTGCLNDYRTEAKVCARCHKDITRDGGNIFADSGNGEWRDFCTETCKLKFAANLSRERASNASCVTCKRQTVTYELEHANKVVFFCGNVCYTAYKYANKLQANECQSCRKYFENKVLEENSMFHNGKTCSFCSPACKNRYINLEKSISQCCTCKIEKYSFDLIAFGDSEPSLTACSLKCLNAYDITAHSNNSTPVTRAMYNKAAVSKSIKVKSLNDLKGSESSNRNSTPSSSAADSQKSVSLSPADEIFFSLPLKMPKLPEPQRNVATMCKVKMQTKEMGTDPVKTVSTGVQKDVETRSIEVQTEGPPLHCVPIPVPIYVPTPMMMYSAPLPVPFPFPIPIPVPIFIPTTKNSYQGISKRIKKILDRSLKDPLQDEMLMLAEMASKGTKKYPETTSDSETESETETKMVKQPSPRKNKRSSKKVSFNDNENNSKSPAKHARFSKQNISYTDYDNESDFVPKAPKRSLNKRVSFNNDDDSRDHGRNHKRVMFETENEAINSPYLNLQLSDNDLSDGIPPDTEPNEFANEEYPPTYREPSNNDYTERKEPKKRKRSRTSPSRSSSNKKQSVDYRSISPPQYHTQSPPAKGLPPLLDVLKKPDNEMHLKFAIGISAWSQWAQAKHAGRFNSDILQLSCEELNASLCLFINEVEKPNGQIYTPDTIFYFCLGIQQHLFLNGRTDNIFYNQNYKQFTDCLDEITKSFLVLYNDADFIVTRIEEEHLWESKQLGAHSPQVLLNTLLFFNTKYFNLTMVEEHKSLWFSHIVKTSKYQTTKAGRTKILVLRYYPNGKEPLQVQQSKARRKNGFQQFENDNNPLRCPIRLYEFYISKCPDNVKESNECFYLMPETSCLPESSVWYSTTSVPDSEIDKVLNRFKVVREVTMALLDK